VLACRWPTIQDSRISRWARTTLQALSWWRYKLGVYAWPFELEVAQKILRPRNPKVESV
jgi:anaerobic magnesium-protoporphyrin IX monomethyl ester cyclase